MPNTARLCVLSDNRLSNEGLWVDELTIIAWQIKRYLTIIGVKWCHCSGTDGGSGEDEKLVCYHHLLTYQMINVLL